MPHHALAQDATTRTQTHRRHGAGRVETRHRRTPQHVRSKAARAVGRTVARCPAPTPVPTATGLLIPSLARSVPRVFEDHAPYAPGYIKELVEMGALKPGDSADSVDALFERAFEKITDPGLKLYEDMLGGMVYVVVGHRGIECNIHQDCHGWRMRLKPIVTQLPIEESVPFIKLLNKSVVQGPWYWGEIVSFGQDEDDARGTGDKWLAELHKKHPALLGKASDAPGQTLMEVLLHTPKKSTPRRTTELRRLIANFIATEKVAAKHADNAALLVTTWDKNCLVNHAHDYIHEGIHGEGWDNQDGVTYTPAGETVAQLITAMKEVGDFIVAVTKLEEWTNAHC